MYALGTFRDASESDWAGVIRDGKVARLSDLHYDFPSDLGALFKSWQSWEARIHDAVHASADEKWMDSESLTAQLPYKPENLFGAGANYRRHVIELVVDRGSGGAEGMNPEERRAFATKVMDERAATGKPYMWVGLRSAIAGPASKLVLPYEMQEPDWELELAVVIGKPARRISREHALEYVAGYTIANDITARDMVDRPDARALGMDWLASKSAPGFHILGPYITPARFVPDPQRLHIRLKLNGDIMQDEGTDDMIHGVAHLIEFTSTYVQLEPGDIIMSGSPSGNGTHYNRYLSDGDVMNGEIDGLVGAQVVHCVEETSAA